MQENVSFPNRVWYETTEGWADREATSGDKQRRELIKACLEGDKNSCIALKVKL